MAKKEELKKLSFDEQIADLEKKYGKNAIANFKNNDVGVYDVFPTGSIKIDNIVLGIGGFAKTKMYQIKGWNGSNKSTLCAHLTANAQKKNEKVVYIDGESAVDVTYFSGLGVDFNKLTLTQPDNAEMAFDIALKLVETDQIGLLIIDSDSSLLPKSIMEAEIGTQTIGKKAKLNSEVYLKLKNAIKKHNVCCVVIAQYRVNPGQMFGDNRVVPGGHALDYYADCIIELTKRLRKEGDETSGTETDFKTSKNKMFRPYLKATFQTIFGQGIDKLEEVIDLANEYGIIKTWGKSVTLLDNGSGLPDSTTKYSLEEFKELLETNEEFFNDIREKTIEKILHPEIKIKEEPIMEITT